MGEVNIFVIIVTYNAMNWAEKCFSSLRNSSVPVKTIVIDNGSTDGTPDFIKNQFPEVEFIQSQENLGFGKANNLGIEIAYKKGADFFYLMNQDTWIFPETFQKLLELTKATEAGIYSPTHLNGSEKEIDKLFQKYIAEDFRNHQIISDALLGFKKKYYKISFLNAAHWLLPKKTIEMVGGFNPFFYHYGEDNDYINRCKFHGLSVVFSTEAMAVHDRPQNKNTQQKEISGLNFYFLKLVNPNENYSYSQLLKEVKRSYFKNKIIGNQEQAKFFKKLKELLITRKEAIEAAQKHNHDQQFSFLNLSKNA